MGGPWFSPQQLPEVTEIILYPHISKLGKDPEGFLFQKKGSIPGQCSGLTLAWCWWLSPVILATQEAEIRRVMV
jgi:hypothetical protein